MHQRALSRFAAFASQAELPDYDPDVYREAREILKHDKYVHPLAKEYWTTEAKKALQHKPRYRRLLFWAVIVSLALAVFFLAGSLFGQQPGPDGPAKAAPAEAGARKSLPPGWTAFGLSQAQKQQVYDIRAQTKKKIDALQKQIADLKLIEHQACLSVLTAEQRKRFLDGPAQAKAK